MLSIGAAFSKDFKPDFTTITTFSLWYNGLMKRFAYSEKSIESVLVQLLLNLEQKGINNSVKKSIRPILDIDLDSLIEDAKCPEYLKDILISYEYIMFDFTEAYESKTDLIASIKSHLHTN